MFQQFYIQRDRKNDWTVRFSLNGIVIDSFTTRRSAQAFINRKYREKV